MGLATIGQHQKLRQQPTLCPIISQVFNKLMLTHSWKIILKLVGYDVISPKLGNTVSVFSMISVLSAVIKILGVTLCTKMCLLNKK